MRVIFNAKRIGFVLALFVFTTFDLDGQALADSVSIGNEVDTLILQGNQMFDKRQYNQALEIANQAIQKTGDAFGKNNTRYFRALETKVRTLLALRKYADAETYVLELLDIVENLRGKESPAYISNLMNLGLAYDGLGKVNLAEQTYLEAKRLYEATSGKASLSYTRVLNNLGTLYRKSGRYEQAEATLLEAKTILEEIGKTNDIVYPQVLNSLSTVFIEVNLIEKAVENLELAVATYRNTGNASSPSCASSLINLGAAYCELPDYEKSKLCYLEAKSILENNGSKGSSSYGIVINNLGGLLWTMGDFMGAEPYYLEAKELFEKNGISCEQCYHRVLRNLALIQQDKGQHDLAIKGFEHVLEVTQNHMGQENVFFYHTLYFLLESYIQLGDIMAADSIYLRNVVLEKLLIRRASAYFSEQELLVYLPDIIQFSDGPLIVAESNEGLPQLRKGAIYNELLLQKGYLLQSSQILNNLASSADGSNRQLVEDWKSAQQSIGEYYSQPLASRTINVDSIENVAITLEKQLVQNLPGFSEARRDVQWQEVQAALKPGEAAVEFVDYIDRLPAQSGQIRYAALVLRPGTDSPVFVPLFYENELLSLTNRSKSWLQDYIEKLYAFRQAGNLKSIYQLVWQPLEKELAGVTTLYYAPAGLLHRLNLEAAQTQDGKRMSDRFQSVVLGSTRQLVVPSVAPDANNRTAMVLGGIRYEAGSTESQAEVANSTDVAGTRSFTFEDADSTLRGNDWSYLPATEKEVRSVDKLLRKAGFKTEIRTGFEATEESVKAAGAGERSPRIVHIATHGFFFPDPKSQEKADSTAPVFKVSDNPMIRSGLLLANANQAWKTGKSAGPDKEDGILTAYEISQLNLQQTELVVLSACETGLGAIEGNEGVYGLQRAFKIAGAQYLIMSLWKVDDNRTQDLMAVFYENWLDKGLDIPEAFEKAKAAMRQKHPNPFYWAGFVLVE